MIGPFGSLEAWGADEASPCLLNLGIRIGIEIGIVMTGVVEDYMDSVR